MTRLTFAAFLPKLILWYNLTRGFLYIETIWREEKQQDPALVFIIVFISKIKLAFQTKSIVSAVVQQHEIHYQKQNSSVQTAGLH